MAAVGHRPRRIHFPLFAVLLLVAGTLSAQQRVGTSAAFVLEEATIESVHAAFASGELTCVALVEGYLRRIEAYDDQGPALRAILTVNPRALAIAARMDEAYRAGMTPGPLHCIPVILKDNYDTADLPTTGGSVTLAGSRPPDDAFIVRRLREAGALILGKANLTELALVGTTVSSLGGQTRNPYDLTRTPGGSSGGTGAAIASSFAVLGTGSDTGQSTRSPASANALVGVRPTRGLVSRDGIIPVSMTQDEGGPITRTVQDAARMLDVIAGYDPADPITARGQGKVPASYTASLDRRGLEGMRIGLLESFMGPDRVHGEVNAVVEDAVREMTRLGATVVRMDIPRLAELTRDISVMADEFRPSLEAYLASLGQGAPVKTLDELIARGEFHPSIRGPLEAYQEVVDGLASTEYQRRLRQRDALGQAVTAALAEHRLDAILYPHQRRLVARIGDDQLERNGVLAHGTGFPAVTFPGGFSASTPTAPGGVPIGIELLGPEWSEAVLLSMAYAFQEGARVRTAPYSTPPLRRDPGSENR